MIPKLLIKNSYEIIDLPFLARPENYTVIEQMAYDIEAGGSPDEAKDFVEHIAGAIAQARTPEEMDALANKHKKIILAMRVVSLLTVKDQDKYRLFAENLVGLFEQEIAEVKYWINYMFVLYDRLPEICDPIKRAILKGFEESVSMLGTSEIIVLGRKASPSIKNWIIDFNGSTAKLKKEQIDEINYSLQSSNVKNLTSEQRLLLKKILGVYDWLRFSAIKPKPEFEPLELSKVKTAVSSAQPKSSASVQKTTEHGEDLEVFREKMAAPLAPKPVASSSTTAVLEIKREIDTKELPQYSEAILVKPQPLIAPIIQNFAPVPKINIAPIPQIPKAIPSVQLVQQPGIISNPIAQISSIEDLKHIDIKQWRRAPLNQQLGLIRSKIIRIANTNRQIPFYAVAAFEQSPLFQTYLKLGAAMIADQSVDRNQAFQQIVEKLGLDMTLAEFEAIADLKKEIEKL